VNATVRLQRQLRDPLQGTSAHHLELRELPTRSLQVPAGLAPATGGTQQSNQSGMGLLVVGLEQAERARKWQRLLGHILQSGDQRSENTHSESPRLLALRRAPDRKFLTIRQIETFQKFALKCLCGLAQRLGRHELDATANRAAQRQDVNRHAAEIEPDAFAIGDDPATVTIINQRPQMT
jgi:hypothetical protein